MKKKSKYEVNIIMACYNAEKYIAKTLDSVFNQSFKNFELICINDGSTDSTLDILEEYHKKHPNMRIYSKKNEGGRNNTKYALQFLDAPYACTVDNDDLIHKDYLKELYETITKNNSDIAICAFQREDFESNKVFSKEMKKGNKTIEIKDDYGALLEINTSMWNKMYRTEILKKCDEFRLDSLGLGDITFMIYMYSFTKRISFIDKVLYYYQVREGSNINMLKESVVDSIYDNLIRIKDYYNKNNKDMIEIVDAFAFLHLGVSMIYRLQRNSENDFKKVYKRNIEVLNKYFSTWKNNKYYSLGYVIKNKGKNFKLFICKLFYKLHLFKLFIKIYDFITSKMKIDIKW